jgi:hypothetical protein
MLNLLILQDRQNSAPRIGAVGARDELGEGSDFEDVVAEQKIVNTGAEVTLASGINGSLVVISKQIRKLHMFPVRNHLFENLSGGRGGVPLEIKAEDILKIRTLNVQRISSSS